MLVLISYSAPGTCKWLKLVLKILVFVAMLSGVDLVPRRNISGFCGLKFERKIKIKDLMGIFCSLECPHPAIANQKLISFFL